MSQDGREVLIARLRSFYALSDEAAEAFRQSPIQLASRDKGEHVVHEGDTTDRASLVLQGVLASTKSGTDGDRQITALHLVGDVPDLYSLHLRVLDSGLQALTSCKLAFIQHHVIHDLGNRFPEITSALWKMTLVDGSVLREWVRALGRLDAISRMAHLFCEVIVRLRSVGASDGRTCVLGLTQVDLADILGLTAVHVNRSLQELRARKLIELDRQMLRVLDWRALAKLADFEPTYLHINEA